MCVHDNSSFGVSGFMECLGSGETGRRYLGFVPVAGTIGIVHSGGSCGIHC
jgi:hypothetical protein